MPYKTVLRQYAFIGYVFSLIVGIIISVQVVLNTASIEHTTERIDVIEDLYKRSEDRWTGSDQAKWEQEFQRLNPTIKMPARKGKE